MGTLPTETNVSGKVADVAYSNTQVEKAYWPEAKKEGKQRCMKPRRIARKKVSNILASQSNRPRDFSG